MLSKTVEKDGVRYTLTDEIQLSAFLSSGWAEVSEEKKTTRKTNKKSGESPPVSEKLKELKVNKKE